jgi:hypothetical protein
MNFTIIGHSADGSYHDRCGDYISKPGVFETQFFREAQKAEFLKTWAHAKYHNTYEDLIILLDGIPDGRLEDEEYEKYEDLEREMEALLPVIKAEHDEAERLRKEAAAEAASQKARKLEADQRARDLAQLEALQRKLGLT